MVKKKKSLDSTDLKLVGLSKTIKDLNMKADQIAKFLSNSSQRNSVVITGDSGMGKTVLIDQILSIAEKKYKIQSVKLDCSQIEPNLLRSELFGHTKGAFTGADKDKIGILEEADGKVLFLDEIGNTTPETQKSLLWALEGREIIKIGGEIKRDSYVTNFGLISATNQDISDPCKFSKELYYRISLWHENIPPLSDRKIDVIPLICDILNKFKGLDTSQNKYCWSIYNLYCLVRYDWNDGGYRELQQEVLYLLREKKLSPKFEIKLKKQINNEPFFEKDMPHDRILEINGKPSNIKYGGKINELTYCYDNRRRSFIVTIINNKCHHFENTRDFTYLNLADRADFVSSVQLPSRFENEVLFIHPNNLLKLIQKEIESYQVTPLENISDPREVFDFDLFFMGLICPGQSFNPKNYIPTNLFKLVEPAQRDQRVQSEIQIKKRYEFPASINISKKYKQITIPASNLEDDERLELRKLLSKYSYPTLENDILKLLIEIKNKDNLSWAEIKNIHGIDRRTLIKII